MITLTRSLLLRRAAVIVGIAGSIVLGAATVRAAGEWTASAAPMAVAPDSAESLLARLSDADARAGALQDQLDALRGNGADLAAALDTAQARIKTDADAATALRNRLASAKTRLATLEASLARARAAAARQQTRAPAPTARPASGGESEGESDG
jgi:chemotaxis protein MotB